MKMRPLRNADPEVAKNSAIDEAFAGVIAQTGTDLVNPLEHGPMGDASGDPGDSAQEAVGDQSPPWLQPASPPAPASSSPTPPETLPAGERPVPGINTRPISKLNLATLPPDVQQYAAHLQREYDTARAELETQRSSLQSVGQYADVAQHLAQFPDLRAHVMDWYRQKTGGAQAPQAPQPDQLDQVIGTLAPEDQQIIRALEARIEKKYQTVLEQRLQPFEQDRGRIQALTEEQEFLREYPEWQEFVDPNQLMRAKELRPNEHLSTLFAALAMPVMVQRVRGGGQPPARNPEPPAPAPRHPAAPSRSPALRLHELARRVAPPAQPQTQPAAAERIVRGGHHAMDDSFHAVMDRLGGR